MSDRFHFFVIALLCSGFAASTANADGGTSKRLHDASGELLNILKDVHNARKAAGVGGAPRIEIETLGDTRTEISEAYQLTQALSEMVMIGCDSDLGRDVISRRSSYTLNMLKEKPAYIRDSLTYVSSYAARSTIQMAASKIQETYDLIDGMRDFCPQKRESTSSSRSSASGPSRTIGSAPGK